jgi:hypothetical protein
MAAQKIQFENEAHQKNREAEESYVRQKVWGTEGSSSGGEGDEVGNVYLGDINHPAPVIFAPEPKRGPSAATIAALIAALAFTGISGMAAGYLFSSGRKAPPASDANFEVDSIKIGLGTYEDLFPQGE